MLKLWTAAVLCASLFCAAPYAEARSAHAAVVKREDPAQIQAKLDSFVTDYLARCNTRVSACKTKPALAKRDGRIVATYIEIDLTSVETEFFPTQDKNFPYMARLSYLEHTYEAVGSTEEEALSGAYKRVKSRRLTELPRYAKGEWHN